MAKIVPKEEKISPSTTKARSLAELWEVPNCGCPLNKQFFCVSRGKPCQPRKDIGKCDCPYLPGPPCRHVLAMWPLVHTVPLALLGAVLKRAYPDEYVDPGPAPKGERAATIDMRIQTMAERVDAGYSPFHPEDRFGSQFLSVQAARARNGSVIEDDVIKDQLETEDEDDSW